MSLDLTLLEDAELAALTLAGRKAAFGEIVRRHRDRLYRLVRGHIGDAEEALDVTQESFASAYVGLHGYEPARPLIAWLVRIAVNKSRDWRRRQRVRRFLSFASALPAGTVEAVADQRPDGEVEAGDRAELERLWEAIAALPQGLKEPLLLSTVEGMSHQQIGEVLGLSSKAVEVRIYRARGRLREKFAAR